MHAGPTVRMCADEVVGARQFPFPEDEPVDLAVEVFRTLADGTRVRLLWLLVQGEASVNEFALSVRKPQAAVSQHLAKLRMAHLVQTRRHGPQVFYRWSASTSASS